MFYYTDGACSYTCQQCCWGNVDNRNSSDPWAKYVEMEELQFAACSQCVQCLDERL